MNINCFVVNSAGVNCSLNKFDPPSPKPRSFLLITLFNFPLPLQKSHKTNTYSIWVTVQNRKSRSPLSSASLLTSFSLRLGSIAPNFKAETTTGPIDFHEFIGNNWVILFSHPEDYTPVCTTELGAFAKLEPEFARRGVKLIGLSANTIESHGGWIKDINEISGSDLKFPIIGDKQRQVALLYDMLDQQDATNVDSKGIAFTIRSVFVIDPKKTIRTILSYPASTGRNTAEVLRIVDSLQTGDKHKVTTPINWVPGDDVIVHPSINNEKAKELFPEFKAIKPYLRVTPLPKEKTSAA